VGSCVASGGNFLWVMWRVVVFSYRRFATSCRDHLQQSAFPDISKKFKY